MSQTTERAAPLHPPVHCPQCGFKIFDGRVIKARIVTIIPEPWAKCRCKHWVQMPIKYVRPMA